MAIRQDAGRTLYSNDLNCGHGRQHCQNIAASTPFITRGIAGTSSVKAAMKGEAWFRLKGKLRGSLSEAGAPDTIRTCGLCLRRAALYPAELRVLTGLPLAGQECARQSQLSSVSIAC
jgi:hypothetical protein